MESKASQVRSAAPPTPRLMPTLPAARERGPEEPMSPLALPRAATEEDDAAEWVSPRVGQRVMVLRDPWLLWILDGKKTMEIRNKRARLGPAWLGQGGKVYGKVNIIAAIPMTETQFRDCFHEHLWPEDVPMTYKTICGLKLAEPRALPKPVHYWRPTGAIGWNTFRTSETDQPLKKETKAKEASKSKQRRSKESPAEQKKKKKARGSAAAKEDGPEA